MKLELKHLIDAYKHQDEIIGSCDSWRINKISNEIVYLSNGLHENQVLFSNFQIDYKIVKHPLSDLTKEIEVNGEKFVPIEKISIHLFDIDTRNYILDGHTNAMPFWVIKMLLEWHFDIYGLIENDLAIDINALEK